MKPLFNENQRFNQWWLWLLLISSSVAPIIILYKEFTSGTSTPSSLFALLILFLVILLFIFLRLKTTITSKSIQLVYFPFVWKTIDLSDITSMKVDRKSTRLNSSHVKISYAVFCLKKKTRTKI